MDQEPDVIRNQIEETRSSLTEKLETLENQVVGTVKDATTAVATTVENVKETVSSTVDNVKETVHETVQSVKEAFDIRHQVEQHPWVWFGGSVVAGLVLESMFPSPRRSSGHAHAGGMRMERPPHVPHTPSPAMGVTSSAKPSWLSGWLGGVMEQFGPEIDKLRSLAIGTAIGVVRDVVKERIPDKLAPNVDELMNNITAKLGGQTIHGPVLESPLFGDTGDSHHYSGREGMMGR